MSSMEKSVARRMTDASRHRSKSVGHGEVIEEIGELNHINTGPLAMVLPHREKERTSSRRERSIEPEMRALEAEKKKLKLWIELKREHERSSKYNEVIIKWRGKDVKIEKDRKAQMNTHYRGPSGVEEAGSPDPKYASSPNLVFRGAGGKNGANELDLGQKRSYTNTPRSQGTVAARLDKLDHQSVEGVFSPILLEQESAQYLESTTSFNSSAPDRQASAAIPTEERSPMLEEATVVPSKISPNVEDLNIRRVAEYRPLFVDSTIPQLLDPPLLFDRSLLFRSYRYMVRQVLGFLQGLNLYEPPLSANCVRLKWICVCGNSFFRDFLLSEVSSAYGLRDLLLISGYQAALFGFPSNSQATAHGSDVMRQSSTPSVNNQGTQPGCSSYHVIGPSNPSQIPEGKVFISDDPSEVLERGNGLKAMWIIICFYYNRHVSQAVHLDTQEGDDDVSLIKHARQKHFEKRGWFAYYLSWKAVTKIAFVKFGYILDPMIEEGLALLHEDWIPPEGWKDTKFWEPCPAEPRPMAEQRFLLHLWDHPHNSRTYLVIQTTKLRLIEQAKSLLTKWRIQKLHCYGWLRETRDQYKGFRGGNTSSEQLSFSNPNDLQRIDDQDDSPQRANGKGRYLFKSTPKRLGEELKAHLDEPPLGWGLHFEENIVVPAPLRYLGIFIIIAMILSVVVSTLILVHEKGVAYFGMGNFGIGIAAIVTTLVLKLIAV